MIKKQKPVSKTQALRKLENFCAYQDRSYREVAEKLKTFDLNQTDEKEILDALIEEKFLDENRYVNSFVRGKLNLKKWGKVKIEMRLRREGIPETLIRKALGDINKDEYTLILKQLIEKKMKGISSKNKQELKYKAATYAIQKGYETELVWKVVNDLAG